jgi:hypothetical protein
MSDIKYKEELYMMTLEEAKTMINPDALSKLHDVVEVKPIVDTSHKVNNDILMTALCKAVNENIIRGEALNERICKLLNSETNSISQTKLTEILQSVRRVQPNMCCIVTMQNVEFQTIMEWRFDTEANFLHMFGDVLQYYQITPADVRKKMVATLKSTIVNNVSQLVSKYYKSSEIERAGMVVSISTIQRLVNMSGGMLVASFEERV